ncbi:uracil DNA glycosylase [Pseudocyphellaria aurata]|nr:uracil DNA glycosylase [Pseudocyphellaria aurata]
MSLKRKAADLTSTAKKPRADASITSFFSAPAPSSSPTTTTSGSTAALPKFDKAKWVESLTAEQQELLKLEIETLHESWLAVLKDEVQTPEFLALKRFLNEESKGTKKIFPPEKDIYSWSQHTPLQNVKVVILGQDPYHGYGQAHGLCFSVRPPCVAPPSLKNIYIALKKDYPSFEPPPKGGGLLTPWADRGVLMLNTCLTVRVGLANSHANQGWEQFTQKVIDIVAKKRTKGVVFLAWGVPAAKRVAKVDKVRNCILQSVHPSPLSAPKGFYDCGHFKKANEWLKQRYGDDGQISWDLNIPAAVAGV